MSENVQGKSGPFSWLNENFEKIFMVTGLLAIILFITWQVIYRYIITQFIERAGAAVWTEELSRYIFIWISYLALSVAIRKRSSIRVDIIYDKLPERLQNISWIIVETLFLVLTGVITYFGWGQIERLLTFPQHTTALRIPFLVPYLILPLGFGLMCLRLLQRIWGQMRVCGCGHLHLPAQRQCLHGHLRIRAFSPGRDLCEGHVHHHQRQGPLCQRSPLHRAA